MTPVPPAASFRPVPAPLDAPALRWGILGPGYIAGTFARAARATRSTVVAVGSRNLERAEAFARANDVPTAYGSYSELLADPNIEAVYVATPHSEHHEHALAAIAAGKHLLVEKAFTRSAREAREVFDAARSAGVFVMEAMWTRFLPHMCALRDVLGSGVIGEVVTVQADHGQWFPFDAKHRLFAPELAGGALLDLGVYPISFAHDVLGAPDRVNAVGALTETGVDGQVSAVLGYGERAQALISTTLWAQTPTSASISGTEGRIEIKGLFYAPTAFTVILRDGTRWDYSRPQYEGGFQYEIAEVARCVSQGRTESDVLPWADTLAVLETMDSIREQVGVVFPGE